MGFNTWAREEPNAVLRERKLRFRRFNTWAREEPNQGFHKKPPHPVFQYLGSRGAQLFLTQNKKRGESFNTWAREEPNPDNQSPQ